MVLAGAAESDRQVQTMAGLCRGAHTARAVIIDSGMRSGVEQFCIRRSVQLIGVCPEDCIAYPKLLKKQSNELANGHSHFSSSEKRKKGGLSSFGVRRTGSSTTLHIKSHLAMRRLS